jgi:alpha-galactosidase
MKNILFICALLVSVNCFGQPDHIELPAAKFNTGDNSTWATAFFNDSAWVSIKTNTNWELQGFDGYNGFAWYRFHFMLPSSLRNASYWKDSLRIFLGKIDDADEVYLNGSLVARHGSFPSDANGYQTVWNQTREIHISTTSPFIQWDKENLLAVRVYDGGGAGGFFAGIPYINMMDLIDGVHITAVMDADTYGNGFINLQNTTSFAVKGLLKFTLTDSEKDSVLQSGNSSTTLAVMGAIAFAIKVPADKRVVLKAVFTESTTGKSVSFEKVNAYILTPASPKPPRINGALSFGGRPGSPLLFRVAASGEKPLQYSAVGLPPGLSIDKQTGVISGRLAKAGSYPAEITVKNRLGVAKKTITIKCGTLLSLTPPMGWNSWNCWGLTVSDERVRAAALAMVNSGLADHGWSYINIDDGWESATRNEIGEIRSNDKFPNMKALGDWLHSQGLKFGIYSSPGPTTCGGYLGSYQHEEQDAQTYAAWGVDYLKYDWCSYSEVHQNDTSLSSYIKPYAVMQKALRAQARDIHYSLCQYGMKKVWQWGADVDANSWRTTGDIEDTWESLKSIGFSQNAVASFAKPGRWNDPDMLVVGLVGWGDNPHPSRLTADEQYTHMSLWSLLSAPLLLGCDLSRIDAFTHNLLSNDEVIAIDQDPLGKQANRVIENAQYQVWKKQLADGTVAIGLFNLGDADINIPVPKKELAIPGRFKLRDCWRQKDLGSFDNYSARVPPHGVVLLKARY